ncbi:MAG: malate dehydrogenase (quinone), partial [Spirochaetia bacterium]|nr:malate dehydrogenase (quinone) [Spirochaetia bacterium]
MSEHTNPVNTRPDVVLIGGGIMSATLGALLHELDPSLSIEIFERLDHVAGESSHAWNNAGTGHSAFCELNYTPESADGSINISKAAHIAESFEESKQFWAHLVRRRGLAHPSEFIHRVPHMSFVWGTDNIEFLKRRHTALTGNFLFKDMRFSDDWKQLVDWMPLVMKDRDASAPVAATRMEIGTDVDFGALTRLMFTHLVKSRGINLHLLHQVDHLKRSADGRWIVAVTDLLTEKETELSAGFVFIGAGGGSLSLLEKSGIPEAQGYAGFPISGQWLRCLNPDVIQGHDAKVYGKAAVGTPPMSVPHLDTRMIGGKKALLFGPYAGFSTKFLKEGSYWDLAKSLELGNLVPMLSVGVNNIPLTRYLMEQATQSQESRIEALREYLPTARAEDWELAVAGQRVQVIKADTKEGGILEFGTELVASSDGSLAALLGA